MLISHASRKPLPMLMQTHEARLHALREELARRALDGFVVPLSDEHLSEYVGSYAQRLAWLTGFGGSAGSVAVTKDKAAIFVDGRYTLQVRDQVDGRLYDYKSVPEDSMADWLAQNTAQDARIGYDAWLHTHGWVKATAKKLADISAELVPVDGNPVDAVWDDRPAPSVAPAFVQDDALTGRSSAEKRAEIADWLDREKCDAVIISALDSVAWTLNVRGSDVERTPVALSYLVVHARRIRRLVYRSRQSDRGGGRGFGHVHPCPAARRICRQLCRTGGQARGHRSAAQCRSDFGAAGRGGRTSGGGHGPGGAAQGDQDSR